MSAGSARRATRYVVGRVEDMPDDGRMIVDVGGRSIGIFRVDGEYYGLLNRCPHAGAELCRGTVVGHLESDRPGEYRFDGSRQMLSCPWHGWEFDIKTGQSYFDPLRTRARAFRITVEDGETVLAELEEGEVAVAEGELPTEPTPGPYKAETFAVTVEDDYLVVSLRPVRER